ncbi:hypothetical protein [Robiginitalea sp. SC105]|uniref:hypothetical protein n=1 Tax=Robiginitalea sp. SC105 TaxID=2762332 RepID=UPI00163A8B75|nr:hypothetical protein [Robiginitalea sp. SC105]MBC2839989.1 hypothetical protein [Robiginitalea sp. SC105]
MKTTATVLFVLFFGLIASAQDSRKQQDSRDQKVATIEMGLVQITEVAATTSANTATNNREVARLYRRSDSRVKKHLHFTTRKDFQMA